jgi:hypothetical protein
MSTKANIDIDQGTSFTTEVLLTDEAGNPLDLSAYTANAQIRKTYTSLTSVPFNTVLSNGQVLLSLSANATGNLEAGRYVYDVVVHDYANNITRVVEGIVTVNPQVTK